MLAPDSILQDRYKIIREIGSGGMGCVYEALDQRLGCIVALKETNAETNSHQRAFRHEASLLASLRHSALPNVMDYFVQKDGQYLVMEFIPGDDLGQLLQRRGGPFSPDDVLNWADLLLDALSYIHGFSPSILHRDIKPANLKVTSRGEIILLDFGLSKGATGQMSTLSKSERVIGYTPAYAPLEQILNADENWANALSTADKKRLEEFQRMETDLRSDLFSVGATLYHLVTGKLAPNAPTRALAVWTGREDPLQSPNKLNPLVTSRLAEVLLQSVSLEREKRFSTAAEMRTGLREANEDLIPTKEREQKKPILPPTVRGIGPEKNRQPAKDTARTPVSAIKYGVLGKCEKQVRSVAFSPCGAFVASGSNDNALRVWDVQTGKARILGYCDAGESGFSYVASVEFTCDGKSVVTGSNDRTVRIWALQHDRMQILATCERSVSAIACSPDSRFIAAGTSDGIIRVWNTPTEPARILGRCAGRVWALAFAPKGNLIAAGSADGTVYVGDARVGDIRAVGSCNSDVRSVAFLPDAMTIVFGNGDGQICLCDTPSGETRTIGACGGRVRSVACSHDGELIASGSEDKTVRLWHPSSDWQQTLGTCDDTVDGVAFAPDGKSLASGSWDNKLRLWKIPDKRAVEQ